jgi:hypothetical protein
MVDAFHAALISVLYANHLISAPYATGIIQPTVKEILA